MIERLERAREAEQRRFAEAQDEIRKKMTENSRALQQRFGSAGHGAGSGTMIGAVAKEQLDGIEQMVRARAKVRRELIESLPELARPEELQRLDEEIQQMISSWWKSLHMSVARHVGGVSYEEEVRRLLDKGYQQRFDEIQAIGKREVAKLEDDQLLGLGKKPKEAGSIHINISESTVGAVNLGTIVGNMETRLVEVRGSGGENFATAMKRLTDAVMKSETIGDRKGEVIEALATIADEAAKPPAERKVSVVKILYERIMPIVSAAGGLAEVWQATHKVILGWFSIQ